MSGTAAILASNRAAPTPAVVSNFAKNRFDWETLLTTTAMPTGGSISRSGNAMQYDSTGKLTWAPSNILFPSAAFTSPWAKQGSFTPTTNNIAPDGTASAYAWTNIVSLTGYYRYQTVMAGTRYVMSVYVKAVSGAPIVRTGSFEAVWGGIGGAVAAWANFSPVTKTFSAIQAGVESYGYEDVGSGWLRVWLVATTNASPGSVSMTCYGGNVDTAIAFWGIQVEACTYESSPRAYLPTTDAARFEPRFDVDPATGQAKGLLVEGARTNIATYSEQFDNAAWVKSNITATPNVATSPDGTTNADKIVVANGATTDTYSVYRNSGISSGPISFSIYAKAAGWGFLRVALGSSFTNTVGIVNLTTGAITGQSGTVTATNVGNGWWRISLSSVYVSASDPNIYFWPTNASAYPWTTGNGTDGVFVWGAQIEAASFPSSYIPTQASSVARLADTFTLTGYANRLIEAYWIEQETGVASSIPETVVSSGAVTINPPTFGWVTSLRAYQNAYAGDITTPSWIDNSGTNGNRMVTDSTGTLTWAPHNLLLNSATLSTQTVTNSINIGGDYILSFKGTGSVAISGGHTATLAGTGANDRVRLKFATTTASLTFTVTGTVTEAQLERVTYQTEPRAWISTSGSQVFACRYDFDAATTPASPRGMLIEEARTNLLTYSQDFSNGFAWVSDGLLAWGSGSTVDAAVAPDGTQTADLITESTATSSHRVYRNPSITVGASYSCSFYVKRAVGSRNLYVVIQNVGDQLWLNLNLSTGVLIDSGAAGTGTLASATSTPVGNGWYRVSLCGVASTTANNVFIQIALKDNASTGNTLPSYAGDGTSGVYIWGAQLEAGAFSTSLIPTTTGSVQRVADIVKLSGTALTTLQGSAATVIFGFNTRKTTAGFLDDNTGSSSLAYANSSDWVSYNGTAIVNSANTFTPGANSRGGLAFNSSGRSVCLNGGTVATNSGLLQSVSTVTLGRAFVTVYMSGTIQSLALYNSRLPDATLQKKSTVGAAY